ncbi:hypothetical protein EDB92DRAFT_1845913 [Lactarius akahatsu]|uniref:Zinc finger C2H2 LYAR-type domain-containing protein n=1 Tax=Lactarius akahatsu TaxID=416441 RepID=A0AAD4QFP5_9AGAM|nr:hypothetical protein EDB92DRAFT_1845913 [Lactarius akahatsu]
MVSFQCDACTDVVKKPKLDRHYDQCRASFTCIDCSATFAAPSQWKGHTSCITEAEKYQKSLYKGPKRGQDTRPSNGNHNNTQPETNKIPGKYHQSQNNQRSWSRRQYVPNYVSGANGTPLGSPHRMSPVDSSAADSLVNAAKTVREVGTKRDSEVLVEADTSNAAQSKSKKKQRRDVPAEVAADEKKTGVVSEPPQEPSSVVNGSTEKHKKGKKSKKKSETQTSPRELALEEHRDEKKSKKRKRKEGDGDRPNDAIEQTDTQLEATSLHLNDKSQDENKAKKRKHKEKRDDGSQSKQIDVAGEETGQVGMATGAEEKKKKKGKDKKASAEEKASAVEKPKKKRKKRESGTVR